MPTYEGRWGRQPGNVHSPQAQERKGGGVDIHVTGEEEETQVVHEKGGRAEGGNDSVWISRTLVQLLRVLEKRILMMTGSGEGRESR